MVPWDHTGGHLVDSVTCPAAATTSHAATGTARVHDGRIVPGSSLQHVGRAQRVKPILSWETKQLMLNIYAAFC